MKAIVIVLLGLTITNGFPSFLRQEILQIDFTYPPALALPEQETSSTKTFPYPSFSQGDTTPITIVVPVPGIKSPQPTKPSALFTTPEDVETDTIENTENATLENIVDSSEGVTIIETRLDETLQVEVPDEGSKIYNIANEESTTVVEIKPAEVNVTPTPVDLVSLHNEEFVAPSKEHGSPIRVDLEIEYGPPKDTNPSYVFGEYNLFQELDSNSPTAPPDEVEFSYQYTFPNVTNPYPAAEQNPLKEENLANFSSKYNSSQALNANISSAPYSPLDTKNPIDFFYEYTIPNISYAYFAAKYPSHETEVTNPTAKYTSPKQNNISSHSSNEYSLSQKSIKNISTASTDEVQSTEFFYQYTIPSEIYSYPAAEYNNLPREANSAHYKLNANTPPAAYDIKPIEFSYEYTIPNVTYPYSAVEYVENSPPNQNIISTFFPAKYDSSHNKKTIDFFQKYETLTINSAAPAKENPVEYSYEYKIPSHSSVEYSLPTEEVINAPTAEYGIPVAQNRIKPAQNVYKYTTPNVISINYPAVEHASLKKVEISGIPKKFPYEPKLPVEYR